MSVISVPEEELDRPVAVRVAVAELDRSARLRERLLAASARASRTLLEAPDVMAAMPTILRELGVAAEVDRTAFAIADTDSNGDRWLTIKGEWIAEPVVGERTHTVRMAWDERKSDCYCSQLQTGRSVQVCLDSTGGGIGMASELAKSSLIVPFLVYGEYAGAIGFDDCHETRQFDPAVVSALEIAASLIGAALHRERLEVTVRHERERAAEQRVAELARTNEALRANLVRLASSTDPHEFMGYMLLEAARQLRASAGAIAMLNVAGDEWRIMAHVRDGLLEDPPFPLTLPNTMVLCGELDNNRWQPRYMDLRETSKAVWPGVNEYHQRNGHQSAYKLPLIFGESTVGFITLSFKDLGPLDSERIELMIALAQQATLAIGLKRLAYTAKNAAVLAERNRIGQEIHDGLAQAFTGILMQLGAAEELDTDSPLSVVLTRIRDIAREGLSEARRSVMAMRPSEGRPGGLALALRQLADRSTVEGRVTAVYEGDSTATGLVPEHEHALLRIAQEAVSNAVRHARPSNVRIALSNDAGRLSLSVSDDGSGMEEAPALLAKRGFGLDSMRERAEAIGGDWHIDSGVGSGTRINVQVSVPSPKRR
jgi:signal transduction histidine kinase